jgi:hypothetical protein
MQQSAYFDRQSFGRDGVLGMPSPDSRYVAIWAGVQNSKAGMVEGS